MRSTTSTQAFPEISVARRGALQDAGAAFHGLADTMPQMIWSTLPDGDHDYYNAQWYRFTGVPEGSTDGESWAGMFHPDDQPEAWRRWNHSLATGDPYEVEYRLRRHDGIYRWVLGRALPIRDGAGRIERWIGTCTDIQDAKESAEQNEILSRELKPSDQEHLRGYFGADGDDRARRSAHCRTRARLAGTHRGAGAGA